MFINMCVCRGVALTSSLVTIYWNRLTLASPIMNQSLDTRPWSSLICIFSRMWFPSAQGLWVYCQFVPSYKVSRWLHVQLSCSFGQSTILCWHSSITEGCASLKEDFLGSQGLDLLPPGFNVTGSDCKMLQQWNDKDPVKSGICIWWKDPAF